MRDRALFRWNWRFCLVRVALMLLLIVGAPLLLCSNRLQCTNKQRPHGEDAHPALKLAQLDLQK
jgi:hypothetical protein